MRTRPFPRISAGRIARIGIVMAATLFAADRADAQQRLVSEYDAKRLALTRAWYSVVDVDPSRGRLSKVLPDGDMIFAMTDHGAIQAIDAESGATLWTTYVGNPNYPSLGPAANEDYVAVVNGSTLYLLGRKQGDRKHQWQLSGGAGGGPCLLGDFVYAALFDGTLEAHKLSDPTAPQWRYQAPGRSLVQPIATDTKILWSTDRGHLYAGSADPPGVDYRLEASSPIATPPAYLAPMVFAASIDGYVYALDAKNGNQRWRYSLGRPIRSPPAAVLDRLFVCSNRPEMVCLNATLVSQTDTEEELFQWRAPQMKRFVARSLDRVYAADAFDRLYVLDAGTGEKLGMLPTEGMSVPVMNQSTDRIFLASSSGLIQCLHEIDRPEPLDFTAEIVRRKQEGVANDATGEDRMARDGNTEDPKEEAPAEDDPFGGADDNPFGEE